MWIKNESENIDIYKRSKDFWGNKIIFFKMYCSTRLFFNCYFCLNFLLRIVPPHITKLFRIEGIAPKATNEWNYYFFQTF